MSRYIDADALAELLKDERDFHKKQNYSIALTAKERTERDE